MAGYKPMIEDEEDPTLDPEIAVDPTAAPLPPPPEAQDPNVQNVDYSSIAAMDPSKFDAKQFILAQYAQAAKDKKSAEEQSAEDERLKQLEAKQMLYNRLGDRVTNLVGSFTPNPVKIEDTSTKELGTRIGSEQMARDKLRQQLLAKSQAGMSGAVKGMVALQGKESDATARRDQTLASQKFTAEQNRLNREGAQSRANTMASGMVNKETAKQAAIPDFDKLSKETQKRVLDINSNSDKILNGLPTFDGKIAELDKALKAGRPEDFLQIGTSMLKYLNDPINADALAEGEAARAAPELKFQLGNMLKPGQKFGRDLPAFLTKVKRLSNILKGSVEKNDKMVEDIKSGKKPNLEKWNVDEPSMGGSGTAMGAPALKNPEEMTDEELLREAGGGQ